ncbi:VOC family protein [Belnapia sp. T6]|uniref:VOC family protein n=1 Tax=Belnapia mucosa TaxID=2804532 RepID=A0ABS1UZK6_9PROT|nr:VOC family protein [Belnapia mucosa]MBL6454886.1 VOC family protein [Belnapia mucosa]
MFRFDHVHLRARDPDAMARFFAGLFGASAQPEGRPGRWVLRLDGQTLLVGPANPDHPPAPAPAFPYCGLEHIGLGVADLDAALDHLRALGADVAIGPLQAGPLRLAFIRGPEGVMVELLERREHDPC